MDGGQLLSHLTRLNSEGIVPYNVVVKDYHGSQVSYTVGFRDLEKFLVMFPKAKPLADVRPKRALGMRFSIELAAV